jgi:hypothetical protein
MANTADEGYCPLCNSYGNVHDSEKHEVEPYNPVKDIVRKTLMAHVPSLSREDEEMIYDNIIDQSKDVADLALRTCACGAKIDGYYAYVDHLTEVFGLEPSHLAS